MNAHNKNFPSMPKVDEIDIARGISIIAVVIGHSGSPFTNFLYLFHLSVFYFISGYLFSEKHLSRPIHFIGKKVNSLYIPFIKYEILFLFLLKFLENYNITQNEINTYSSKWINIVTFGNTEQLLLPFWFLTSLFTVHILFFLLLYTWSKIAHNHKLYLVSISTLVLFTIGFYISERQIRTHRQLDISLIMTIFFLFGYLYKKNFNLVPMKVVIALSCLFLLIINSFRGRVDVISNFFVSPEFLVFNSLLGIYVVFFISKYISDYKNIIRSFLILVGNNTLHILALHLLSFKVISMLIIQYYSYPAEKLLDFPVIKTDGYWWILYSIVGIMIPLILALVLKPIYQKFVYYLRAFLNTALTPDSSNS